jgi:predicted nucleic acid-binding Zn ribbon protein
MCEAEPIKTGCPVCEAELKPRQKYCSGRCRVRAFRLREAARIADEVRAEVYQILARRMIK